MTDNRAKTADALAAAEDKFRVAQKKMERATAKRAAALEAVRAAREEHKRAKYPAEPGHGATLLDTATAIPEIRGHQRLPLVERSRFLRNLRTKLL